MKKEEIIKGNKLIAEFMGAKYDKDVYFPVHPSDLWLPTYGIVNYTTVDYGNGKILEYHCSWNWLMPVVAKITKNESFIGNKIRENLMDVIPFGNIDDVYPFVIEFINFNFKFQ